MHKLQLFIILFVFLLFSGCSVNKDSSQTTNLPVIAVAIVPQSTFAKEVAGDLVDILTLIPSGYSPANYQPTSREMIKLSDASMYFTLGMPAERANILPKIYDFNKNIVLIDMQEIVFLKYPPLFYEENEYTDEHEHSTDDPDPHIWLSPLRAIEMVKSIRDGLVEIDSKNSNVYIENAQNYINRLLTLDKEIRTRISNLNNKTFLIYHGSYAYLAHDYGLEMIAIEGGGKPATASRLAETLSLAKEKGIKDVFYQEEFDGKQAKTVADELGGSAKKLTPLSPDYIDGILAFIKLLEGE